MPKKSANIKEDAERQEHILDLQRRAKELTDDELSFLGSEQMSTELQEQFWERVVAFEEAKWVTSFDQLV